MTYKTVSPFDLQTRRLLRPVALIDVREPDEFKAGHIPGARSVPLSGLSAASLAANVPSPKLGREEPLYLTCLSRIRAEKAAGRLSAAGLTNLVLLEGGAKAWEEARLPIRRCGASLNLMRQVQIAVGILLVLKVVLGFTLHQLFFAAAGMIGIGLLAAGLTNWCGMAQLLARMPWNRPTPCAQGVSS